MELKNNEYASDVEFTDKNVRNFFEGYSVVLKQDGELMALNSVWENVPQFELVAPEDAATVTNGHEENYELTETSAAIVTPAPELVGDVITSGAFIRAGVHMASHLLLSLTGTWAGWTAVRSL